MTNYYEENDSIVTNSYSILDIAMVEKIHSLFLNSSAMSSILFLEGEFFTSFSYLILVLTQHL